MNDEILGGNSLQLFFLIAPILILVNSVVSILFALKYKRDFLYRNNAIFWFSYFILCASQGALQNQEIHFKLMTWSVGSFVVISFLSVMLSEIIGFKNNYKSDIVLFLISTVVTSILFKTNLNFSLAGLPMTFFAAFPVLKYSVHFKKFKGLHFSKNGMWLFGFLISLHVVDYTYFADKPQYMFPGYLLALMLMTGVASFIYAALIERVIVEVEMKDMLYNTARLRALGAMSAEIAHEIKNPLTVLSMSNYQLKQRLQVGQIDNNYLLNKIEVSEKMTQRLSKILDGLKAHYQSGDHDDFQTVILKDIFEETKVLCEVRTIKNKVNLSFDESHENAEIECRSVQITQILQNLIQNAIDVLEEHKGDRWIRVQTQLISGGRELRLTVTDSGPGIPESIKYKIFESLFTTKSNGKGTGLGLSISKRFAEEHGGTLFLAESVQTQFVLLLPLKQYALKTKNNSQSKVS